MAKLTIAENICKGCGLCINACPKGILALNTEKLNAKGYHPASVTDMAKCIACAMCATVCPDTVIRVERDV